MARGGTTKQRKKEGGSERVEGTTLRRDRATSDAGGETRRGSGGIERTGLGQESEPVGDLGRDSERIDDRGREDTWAEGSPDVDRGGPRVSMGEHGPIGRPGEKAPTGSGTARGTSATQTARVGQPHDESASTELKWRERRAVRGDETQAE